MGGAFVITRYDLAPLDGITKTVFRRVWHEHFGGADRFFIPFFSPTSEHVMMNRDLKELDRARNAGLELVPQVMTKRAEDFLWAIDVVKDLGYTEANLNLGCPSGTVAGKGKGSGFLAHPDDLDRFFDEVFSKAALPVSVKTRLGIHESEEFPRLMEIYNRYPIHCLTIHPRVQKQFYKGEVHMDTFAQALEESKNPVCYNGDLKTVEDIRTFEANFPSVDAVMIGRGAIADPALLRKIRGGSAATREELQSFTQTLYHAYTEFYEGQDAQAAQRMKEIWFYLIHLFVGGERIDRKLRRNRNPREYEQLEATIFRDLPLLDHAEGALV
jgi:tRNA-dihydrouridine synthase